LVVKANLAGIDPRGSDVRLDSGELMCYKSWPRRPISVDKWEWATTWVTRWKKHDPIVLLEALAVHLATLWRLKKYKSVRTTFLHLCDNQASLAIMSKHRSSSRALHRIARRSAAMLLAASCKRTLGYTSTDENPADDGSRLHAAKKKA
jgi:hypothetical protein